MLIDIYFVIRVITEAGTVYTSGSHEIIPVLMGFLLLHLFFVVFGQPLYVYLTFFFWSLYRLSSKLRLLVTHLISSKLFLHGHQVNILRGCVGWRVHGHQVNILRRCVGWRVYRFWRTSRSLYINPTFRSCSWLIVCYE